MSYGVQIVKLFQTNLRFLGYISHNYVGLEFCKCYSLVSKCAADAWRNTLAGVFPESPVLLLGHLRPGPLLPGRFRVPRHGRALRSHRGHRGLHRLVRETHMSLQIKCTGCVCFGGKSLDGSMLPLDLREAGK